ncbi:MAG: AraC family transcriptional regulator [Oscillospiraceae bacterium]|nr:AraC family transcriptional regulator [Oscillospiraceae bacterium]
MERFANIKIPDFITINNLHSVFSQKYSDIIPPDSNYNGEAHDFWEFFCLEQGEINLLIDGELYHLYPGQFIMYAPYSFHSFTTEKDAFISVVTFSTFSNLPRKFVNNILNLTENQKTKLREITTIGEQILELPPSEMNCKGMVLQSNVPEYKTQKLANLVELFLIDLYEHNSPLDKLSLNDTKKYPNEQFAMLTAFLSNNLHRPLSTEEISAELSIGVSKLGKLCKSQCGCGPIDYFISLKIGAAKRMISEKRLNLTQISENLGFSSVHYFSRLFKAKTGITPSDYAKSVNG